MKPVEAARRLRIPTRELYRLIDRGQVPAYKFGRTVRLLVADVEEYLRRHPSDDYK
ncbi:MAG TPA: helix-turn-helix domain-containing protein [Acidimicrobiales bacterium]|nr:helix-turn-helix domain-containing protein [Acidimicrobiales bacterium]